MTWAKAGVSTIALCSATAISSELIPNGYFARTQNHAKQEIPMPQLRYSLLVTAIVLLFSTAMFADRDEGRYVILSAQYGTREHHVDVTDRLRELARADRPFRMGNSTFGIDPDHGHIKTLRIFARGPRGEERIFEFREGSTVDGAEFRGWSRGDWGRGGWSGRWGDNDDDDDRPQPEMSAALDSLRDAQQHLLAASSNKGGHRERAAQLIEQAISELQQGMQYADRH